MASASALRPFRPGDAEGILALFSEVHGRALPPRTQTWRYDGRPTSPSVRTVAEADGRIVAHLGTLTFPMDGPAGPLCAGLWTDLMVHPAFRDLALFMDMAEANTAACAAAGLALLYAFPNDRSFPLLRRLLDWTDLGDLAAFEGPPAPAPAARVEAGLPASGELDALWPSLRDPHALSLRRDAAWTLWRFARRPQAAYKTFHLKGRGWAAAKVFSGPEGRVGDILEVTAADEPAQRALAGAAVEWFRAEGAGRVSAWAAPGDPRGELWSALGLSPAGPRTHFAVKVLDEPAAAFAREPRIWRISKGDSDVF